MSTKDKKDPKIDPYDKWEPTGKVKQLKVVMAPGQPSFDTLDEFKSRHGRVKWKYQCEVFSGSSVELTIEEVEPVGLPKLLKSPPLICGYPWGDKPLVFEVEKYAPKLAELYILGRDYLGDYEAQETCGWLALQYYRYRKKEEKRKKQ